MELVKMSTGREEINLDICPPPLRYTETSGSVIVRLGYLLLLEALTAWLDFWVSNHHPKVPHI